MIEIRDEEREVDRQLREETRDLSRYLVKCASSGRSPTKPLGEDGCSNTIHILERDRRYYESAARQPVLCGPCEYRKANSRRSNNDRVLG